jgi:hypothetical protein
MADMALNYAGHAGDGDYRDFGMGINDQKILFCDLSKNC